MSNLKLVSEAFSSDKRHVLLSKEAYPNAFAFKTYAGLIVIQLFLALVMPGVDQEGMYGSIPIVIIIAGLNRVANHPQVFPYRRSTTRLFYTTATRWPRFTPH